MAYHLKMKGRSEFMIKAFFLLLLFVLLLFVLFFTLEKYPGQIDKSHEDVLKTLKKVRVTAKLGTVRYLDKKQLF